MSLKNKYLFLDRLNISKIYNVFLNLPPQQQTVAMIVAGIVAVILFLLPISIASNKIESMQRKLNSSQDKMGGIVNEIDNYNNSKAKLEDLEKKIDTGFEKNLATLIAKLAAQAGISDENLNLNKMPDVPSDPFNEYVVDVRLKKISLTQLTDFLFAIENDKKKLLRIKDLKIDVRHGNRSEFNVTFKVSTYELLKPEE